MSRSERRRPRCRILLGMLLLLLQSGRLVRFQGELGYGGHTREGEVGKENEESVVLHLLSSMFDS